MSKKNRTIKKQLRRLWDATAHVYADRYFEEYMPAKKPITGRTARRLIGTHYRVLGEYGNGWANVERPKFNLGRKYVILAEHDSQYSCDEYLRVARADSLTGIPAGIYDRGIY